MSTDLSYTIDKDGELLVPFTINGKASSRQILLQKVMNIILTEPDDPYRDVGGGLYGSLRSANLNQKGLERVKNLINIAISETVEQLRAQQAANTDLPDEEKLSSLSLTDVSIQPDNSLYAEFTIVSASGEETAAQLNLEL